jgi:hypothetical protein
MKSKLYSVYDVKVCFFFPPFAKTNDYDALRVFLHLKGQPGSDFNRFPQDYQLYHIGEFNDETGLVSGQVPPRLIQDVYATQPDNLGEQV